MSHVSIPHSTFQSLAIRHFRYCLGRMTYVVRECDEFIRTYWQDLAPNTQQLIASEIEQALNDHDSGLSQIGMQSDYETWRTLLAWTKYQQEINND